MCTFPPERCRRTYGTASGRPSAVEDVSPHAAPGRRRLYSRAAGTGLAAVFLPCAQPGMWTRPCRLIRRVFAGKRARHPAYRTGLAAGRQGLLSGAARSHPGLRRADRKPALQTACMPSGKSRPLAQAPFLWGVVMRPFLARRAACRGVFWSAAQRAHDGGRQRADRRHDFAPPCRRRILLSVCGKTRWRRLTGTSTCAFDEENARTGCRMIREEGLLP